MLVLVVWVLVMWSRKSCLRPAVIAPFVFLILFKDGKRKVSLRFHLFLFDVHQENKTLTTIPEKIFGTKWSNPVKLDRKRKVWYLFLRVF